MSKDGNHEGRRLEDLMLVNIPKSRPGAIATLYAKGLTQRFTERDLSWKRVDRVIRQHHGENGLRTIKRLAYRINHQPTAVTVGKRE